MRRALHCLASPVTLTCPARPDSKLSSAVADLHNWRSITNGGDTRADWSEAFELVPSLQVAYV
jgi:hypothetical protein